MTLRRWLVGRVCAVSFSVCAAASAGPSREPPAGERAPTSASAPQTPAPEGHDTIAPDPDLSEPQRKASDHLALAFKLYDEGAHDAALSELKRAYELAPTYRILYNLGVMSLAVHDAAGAMEYFERYLAEGADAIPEPTRIQIHDTLAELAQRVAKVTIAVNVPGAEVSVDDRVVGTAPLGSPLRLNAGSRRIAARASGWLPDSTLLSLTGGDSRPISLTLADPRPPPLAPTDTQPTLALPWLGFGATALLTTGAILSGVQALSAQHDFERQRRTLDTRASALRRSDAKAFRWSVAADSLGVAALAVGGYSLYLALTAPGASPSDPATPSGPRVDLSANGLRLSGAF